MKHFLPDYFVCPSFLSPEESPSCTLYFLTVDQSSSHVPLRYFTFLWAVISLNAFKTRNKFFYNAKLKIKFILNKKNMSNLSLCATFPLLFCPFACYASLMKAPHIEAAPSSKCVCVNVRVDVF